MSFPSGSKTHHVQQGAARRPHAHPRPRPCDSGRALSSRLRPRADRAGTREGEGVERGGEGVRKAGKERGEVERGEMGRGGEWREAR